jgi:hypothetical protein
MTRHDTMAPPSITVAKASIKEENHLMGSYIIYFSVRNKRPGWIASKE